MNKKNGLAVFISVIIASMFAVSGNNVSAVKCEDIKYEGDPLKWDPQGHDDNNPSEKKFYKVMQEKTFCEVNKMIDHEEIEGEIKEDTKHDMDWLKTTLYYESAAEESQENLRDAYYNSPSSDGKDNLADYEMVEAGY